MSELSSDEENVDVLDEEIDDILEHHFDLESDNTENNPSFFRQSVLSNPYIKNLMKLLNFTYSNLIWQ